ncbi:MAG: hypothetical protein GY858_10185 [Candidatus Omnitrophica bacterium]|nr:hypothetical protein [Candidatus Omnitrophota bacterium]
MKIGIPLGVLGFFGIMALLTFYLRKCRKQRIVEDIQMSDFTISTDDNPYQACEV